MSRVLYRLGSWCFRRRYKEAEILAHLGDAHGAAGNTEDARTAWWRSLEILSDFGHRDAERMRAKLRKLGLPKPAPGQEL